MFYQVKGNPNEGYCVYRVQTGRRVFGPFPKQAMALRMASAQNAERMERLRKAKAEGRVFAVSILTDAENAGKHLHWYQIAHQSKYWYAALDLGWRLRITVPDDDRLFETHLLQHGLPVGTLPALSLSLEEAKARAVYLYMLRGGF